MKKSRTRLDEKQRLELILIFSAVTFAIFVASLLCVSALTYIVVRTGALQIVAKDLPGGGRLIIFVAITSALIGLLTVSDFINDFFHEFKTPKGGLK